MLDRIKWQGGGSFRIEGEPSIQIAPWRVARQAKLPDVILIGSDRYDHCSPADVAKLRGADTQIIGSQRVADVLDGATVLRAWQSIRVGKATITAVPAIAANSGDHSATLGFRISLDMHDIYYVGDSAQTASSQVIRPDILMLPIGGGRGRMTLDEALRLVEMLKPRWAIPYNWGGGSGATELDARSFQSRVGDGAEAILLRPSN